jgi:putative flippase GtrA
MASSEAPGQARGAWQRQADWTWGMLRRIHLGARRPANWTQLFQFGVVGAVGYFVNLAVFAVLTLTLDVQHILAAVLAFGVAVTNNFLWNRVWTFKESAEGGHAGFQATRFFAVSLGGLGARELPSQAIAIAIAMPVNFIGNKLWTFAWS